MSRLLKASLLTFFFSLCQVAFIVSHQVRQRTPVPAPRELFAVVNSQLAALRMSDFPGAYRCASTGVQQKFTLPQFAAMVRRDYGRLADPQRVEFGSVRSEGANATVEVFFFAADGSVRVFVYSLVAEAEGWKVDTVEERTAFPALDALVGLHV